MLNIIKSQSDKRIYLYKRLPNLLKCLLVSDVDADKSAAAVNVNIGSLFDPKDFPGLAHFLEHMLFMGTKKYPKENDFSEYLNKNSGYSNAYTDLDCTNYYFEVNNENFLPALDRFSQFFVHPLFEPSAVEREVEAVDSENKKNLQSDLWRKMQLIRSEANKESIFNRFATGNLETLKKDGLRENLVEFHDKYYSSHLMSLVVVSNLPIEHLSKLTDDLFTDVPIKRELDKLLNTNVEEDHWVYPDINKLCPIPAYDKDNCGNLYHITPVKDQDEILIYWYFNENFNKYYKEKPLDYLSAVLGNEGPNSLTSCLIKDDLISSLSCGGYTYSNTYSTLYFQISLTKKGLSNTDDVISRVFDAVNNLKTKPINKRYYEEVKMINKIKFDYKSKEDPTDYCSDLSSRFTTRKPEDVLFGDYNYENFDENLIKKTFSELTLENINIYLSSKEYETKCANTEQWYGTKYTKEKLPERLVKAYNEGSLNKYNHVLDYPPVNNFIAKDFILKDLTEKDIKYPVLVEQNQTREIWFKQDNVFFLPKATIYLQIYLNKDILPHAEYSVISYIWNNLFQNELQEIVYMAREASVNINFYFNLEGLSITIEGFSSALKSSSVEILKKFQETIEVLKERLNNLENHPEKSGQIAEKIMTKLMESEQENSNFYLGNPYNQVLANLDIYLRNVSIEFDKKLQTVRRLQKQANQKDLSSFSFFLNNFLNESKFEWVIQGNLTKEEAIELVDSAQNILHKQTLSDSEISSIKIAKISKNTNYYVNSLSQDPNNLNSSIISYFQAGKLSHKESCILMVIEALFREKFFDELRTKQALGYIVKLGLKEIRDVNGVICIVQSSVKSPEYLQNIISEFFLNLTFEEFDEETFKEFVSSVIVELKKKDLKLADEINRNFTEIKSKNFYFDRRENYVEILKNIKIEEVKECFNKLFLNNEIRRLDVGLIAHCHLEENNLLEIQNINKSKSVGVRRIKVSSANEFKKNVSHFPDFYSKSFKYNLKI